MIEAFEDFISEYGDIVTILTRTPSEAGGEIVKDDRGHIIYDEEEIDTIARIRTVRPNEQLVKQGVLKLNDAVGLFSLTERDYIKTNNTVVLKQFIEESSYESRYEMMQPIIKKTHIEVNLKRVDI